MNTIRYPDFAPTLAVAVLALICTGVAAQDEATYDRVGLSVSEVDDVANDLLVAVLFSEHEGRDAALVADSVNQDIAWAMQLVGARPAVKTQTLHYRTHPITRNQNITGWRTRQSIRLEARDNALLSNLIGELQERLKIASLSYDVSRSRRASLEQGLVTRALEAFAKRAALIAATLGRDGYRIVRLDVATEDQRPQPPMQLRAMATMERTVAPPTLAPGEQQIGVTVSGTVELLP